MKRIDIIPILLLILIGFGSLIPAIPIITKTFDKSSPMFNMTAPYASEIEVDGVIDDSEWDYTIKETVTCQPMEDMSLNTLSGTINFAYNETYLFGSIYFPNTAGSVNAVALIFFGKTGQKDGVYIESITGDSLDFTFDDLDGPYISDEDVGGTNNVISAVSTSLDASGTSFEFAKLLVSGEGAPVEDISLNYGQSIAVSIFAWVGPLVTVDTPANYGTFYGNILGYIHLSIGEDTGDVLDDMPLIFTQDMVVKDTYEVIFNEEHDFVLDCEGNDSVWDDAMDLNFKLTECDPYSYTWNSQNTRDVNLKIAHDGENIYMFMTIENTSLLPYKFAGIMFFDTPIMNESIEYDMIYISQGYYDDLFYSPENAQPLSDTIAGGTINGNGTLVIVNTKLILEFYKPINVNDYFGKDLQPEINGDAFYIMIFLMEYDSTYQNMIQFYELEIDETSPNQIKFQWNLHAVKLLGAGELPSDTDTVKIGFEFADLLIVCLSLTPIVIFIHKRRRKS